MINIHTELKKLKEAEADFSWRVLNIFDIWDLLSTWKLKWEMDQKN